MKRLWQTILLVIFVSLQTTTTYSRSRSTLSKNKRFAEANYNKVMRHRPKRGVYQQVATRILLENGPSRDRLTHHNWKRYEVKLGRLLKLRWKWSDRWERCQFYAAGYRNYRRFVRHRWGCWIKVKCRRWQVCSLRRKCYWRNRRRPKTRSVRRKYSRKRYRWYRFTYCPKTVFKNMRSVQRRHRNLKRRARRAENAFLKALKRTRRRHASLFRKRLYERHPLPFKKGYRWYRVRKGDTYESIGRRKLGAGWKGVLIVLINNPENPEMLEEGDRIMLPPRSGITGIAFKTFNRTAQRTWRKRKLIHNMGNRRIYLAQIQFLKDHLRERLMNSRMVPMTSTHAVAYSRYYSDYNVVNASFQYGTPVQIVQQLRYHREGRMPRKDYQLTKKDQRIWEAHIRHFQHTVDPKSYQKMRVLKTLRFRKGTLVLDTPYEKRPQPYYLPVGSYLANTANNHRKSNYQNIILTWMKGATLIKWHRSNPKSKRHFTYLFRVIVPPETTNFRVKVGGFCVNPRFSSTAPGGNVYEFTGLVPQRWISQMIVERGAVPKINRQIFRGWRRSYQNTVPFNASHSEML